MSLIFKWSLKTIDDTPLFLISEDYQNYEFVLILTLPAYLESVGLTDAILKAEGLTTLFIGVEGTAVIGLIKSFTLSLFPYLATFLALNHL